MQPRGKVKVAFIAGCFICIAFYGHAQTVKDHLAKAERFYHKKDYKNALENYLEALAIDANDPQTNFKAGISYLNEGAYTEALTYLEKAYQLQAEVDPDIDYHLGVAYQENHQFAKAREHFGTFRLRNKKLSAVANQKIAECTAGDSLMRLPAHADVEMIPGQINTPFADFSPLTTPDGRALIFTSNRSADEYQMKTATNSEDVYISKKNGSEWTVPEKISGNINVRLNESAMCLSPDGKTLYLFYEEGAGDIYTSDLENGEWSRPVPLNKFINHPQYRESDACVSPDGKKLYFSSNRPGGKGGFDIYVCELGSNGQWGRPSNLGSAINTRRNEDSPFLHADGLTLFFSSNGHPTLGQNDIFKSTLQNGKWTPAENLGYPINTSAFEGYFILSQDGKRGYFSSSRGSGGDADIYTADFFPAGAIAKTPPNGSTTSGGSAGSGTRKDNKIVTVLRGAVIDVNDARPLEANIRLVDNSTKGVVSEITTGPSGTFEMVIPHGGNFGVTTEKQGYLFNSMNFNLPAFEKYQEIDTHILMVKAQVGSKVVLKNIFFDVNQSALKSESLSELENIRNILIQNPQWRIQINGHTDNIGHPTTNRALSLRRAESVVEYLVKHGIAGTRLQAKGYGSERPLVSNDDEAEGRQINRRTEIEIIE
jgi:outer membrane protein OmpA-like peptidoglycan-associated protein